MNTLNLKEAVTSKKFILGISLVICAVIFLFSARGFSNQGKYVEVKGLSERVVKSDRAIWSMGFEVKSNDINQLYADIEKYTQAVEAFLITKGLTAEEISTAPVNVYQDTYREALYRYNANVQMSVYTENVDLVRKASEETLPLIKQGIVFNSSFIDFQFIDLNSIKPEMLEEAIANARVSAEQFAQDSGSRIGGISRANQGVFTITEKDPGSPEFKEVRVVSTLRFMLK
ncbi:MAG: SIMPL domain-containing protein [Candidatus Pacebacteria bacterium]|nr:SIMPL domain-containing protein [Candidatus Paceibacterota bacterium]